MREDDIDRAIDEVAWELTAGEPDGAFRARVMARIGSAESRRIRSGWMMALPVAAVILIALVAAWSYRSPERLALHRPETLARHPPETIALQRDERPTVAYGPIAPTARRVEVWEPTKGARAVPPSLRLRRTRRASVRRLASSEVGALAPPPLDVPSIALAPLDRGDSIQLRQLEPIAPIDLHPLGVEPANREPEPGTSNQNREP